MTATNGLTWERVTRAWQTVWELLLARRSSEGYWRGYLCSSPLATATAVSALTVFKNSRLLPTTRGNEPAEIQNAIVRGTNYLEKTQRPDGGWGDTERSLSNVATTYLVIAAIKLACETKAESRVLDAAMSYVRSQREIEGLRNRYGADQTFVAPILTNCALAGLSSWEDVPQLAFELAAFPQSFYRFLQMPVVSYAIPALVAVGLARHRKVPTPSLLLRGLRNIVAPRCLEVAQKMQPESGGYLEAVPLTSFVAMCLCSAGLADHPIVEKAINFLLRLQRDDGSWPVDVDLATWLTTLTINAVLASKPRPNSPFAKLCSLVSLDWLAGCQWLEVHPFTGSAPGGWGWTDHPGAVPDVDDTAGALLALGNLWRQIPPSEKQRLLPHILLGLDWLLELQNRDGGWPTFCRGWGRFPFDRSAVDLTAHAIRALQRWIGHLTEFGDWIPTELFDSSLMNRIEQAVRRHVVRLGGKVGQLRHRLAGAVKRGVRFLGKSAREDGAWVPLWFGNERLPDEGNPVYGTARCLLALEELNIHNTDCRDRGVQWLVRNQKPDGSWGLGAWDRGCPPPGQENDFCATGSVEETALAVAALSGARGDGVWEACRRGVAWLVQAVEQGKVGRATPIGLYFARLWYFEEFYPLIFTVEGLGRFLARSE